MRAVVQRVAEARVDVDSKTIGQIPHGFLVLVCAMQNDCEETARWLARKILTTRIFKDDQGKMNLSLAQVRGSILVVSQFTLSANGAASGNRPGFSTAAPAARGEELYDIFCQQLSEGGVPVERGIFGADMKVSLVNDGPVTIIYDTEAK